MAPTGYEIDGQNPTLSKIFANLVARLSAGASDDCSRHIRESLPRLDCLRGYNEILLRCSSRSSLQHLTYNVLLHGARDQWGSEVEGPESTEG